MAQKRIIQVEPKKIHLYISRVLEDNIDRQILEVNSNQLSIFELFMNVSTTAGQEYNFNDLKPKTNVRESIFNIMDTFPNEKIGLIRLIFNDFKDELKTLQRMSNRYVLIAVFENNLEIIHSRKEPGIGQLAKDESSPMEIIRRFFDTGNVDRWVRFYKDQELAAKVRIYERYKSPILYRFLQVPKSDRIYEFGDIRIIVKLLDNELTVNLSNEEAVKKIIDSNDIAFSGNYVIIGGTKFHLVKIFSSNEPIENPIKLKLLLTAEKYNLTKIIEQYKELPAKMDYYGARLMDNKYFIYRMSAGEAVVESKILEKPEQPLDIVCVNDCIWIDQSYLESLVEKICTNKQLTIFHPAFGIRDTIIDMGGIQLLNDIEIPDPIAQIVKGLINLAYQYDTGTILRYILLSHSMGILSKIVDKPLSNFFSALSNGICSRYYVDLREMVTKHEDSYIEYKSGKKLTGDFEKDQEIINEDIIRKASNYPSRLIIYGINEENMEIDKINNNVLQSDFIGRIEEKIKERNPEVIIKSSTIQLTEDQKVLAFSVVNKDYTKMIDLGTFG